MSIYFRVGKKLINAGRNQEMGKFPFLPLHFFSRGRNKSKNAARYESRRSTSEAVQGGGNKSEDLQSPGAIEEKKR